MSTHLAPLKIRQRLGRADWGIPEPFGPDGWRFRHRGEPGGVIITCAEHPGIDGDIVHVSMAFRDRDPTYTEMAGLHQAVWPSGYAYMVFTDPTVHVNIHPHALHLWGRLDGDPLMPEMSEVVNGLRTI